MATQRITNEFLDAQVDTINRILGFDPDTVTWNTVGAVTLYKAYGSTGVHQTCNESGGESDLMGWLGTKREAALFLKGMIQALRLDSVKVKG